MDFFPKLFSPIAVGPLEIANRVVLAPVDVGLHGPNGEVTERYIDFIVDRARGQTGLLITEFTTVTPEKRVITTSVWDDRFIPGLARMAEAVHDAGSPIFMQIAALGGKSYVEPFAPSAVDSPLYEQTPREMTVDEIKLMVERFIQGARRAKQAGFDGVEYHCAHSYLGGQFISPHTNRREDDYGGDFDGRMRFGAEVIAGIRQECGDDFPIGFKFSAHEHLHGGVNDHYDEGENDKLHLRVAEFMEKAGVAYLHVATTSATLMRVKGFVECTHPSVPPMYIKPNTLVDLAEEVKANGARVPVIATGGITDPADAEDIIASGRADMVALGRTLIADGHWARKARVGENIAPCIRCNFCHSFVVMDRGRHPVHHQPDRWTGSVGLLRQGRRAQAAGGRRCRPGRSGGRPARPSDGTRRGGLRPAKLAWRRVAVRFHSRVQVGHKTIAPLLRGGSRAQRTGCAVGCRSHHRQAARMGA